MVVSDLNNGAGIERVCSMLANGLSESGYKIVLATITPSERPFFPLNKNIQIISLSSLLNCRLCRIPNTIYQIRKLLKKERIDTVIAVDTLCALFTVPATLGLPINHIAWEHFNFKSNLGQRKRAIARKLAARYCDSIVTLTERDKKYWLEGTHHKSQITAIANPCPFPVQKYIREENTKIVLAIGRLNHQKGFDLLLEAWIQVNKVMPDWKLKIVGNGEERAKLTEIIEKNKLFSSVELVGSTNNVSIYYQQAEILCLSSRFEGFPMVLLESLAFGLPVVGFNCDTGPSEILEGTGSILVPENDVNKLALSLTELMNCQKTRLMISLKSKDKAKLYQPENIIDQWIALLESFK